MSRNKTPEVTRQKILDVAMQLFLTKGYEKTSLQDIITQLDGLTKGAIYYHFKSKEDILIAVVEYLCRNNGTEMAAIRDDKTLNGVQRLEKMFQISIANPKQETLFSITPNLLDNPAFLTYYIKNLINSIIPDYVTPVIKDGIADGSIHAESAEELSSMIMFLTDVWLNPLVLPDSTETLVNKAKLINQIMKPFGIHVFDPITIEHLERYRSITN